MAQLTAREVEQQYHSLAAAGEYAQALELVTRHFDVFSRQAQSVVYYWRIMMACRLNDRPLALATLQRAVDAGHWYDDLAGDEDLSILAGSAEFDALVGICDQRRQEAIANSQPVMRILRPRNSPGLLPLVIALHGNNSNAELFEPRWKAAPESGWLVALPQAPQPHEPGRFSWNDWDWATQSLTRQYSELFQDFQVDPGRIILAGFSMGAGLALNLALEGAFPVRGVLCVAPFVSEVESLKPLLSHSRARNLRIFLVASPEDQYCHSVAVQLASMLPAYGIEHRLELYDEVGHSFPLSFEARLPEALDFLLGEK